MHEVKVGDRVMMRVTAIDGGMVRLEADNGNYAWVLEEVLEGAVDSMVTVEKAWDDEQEADYRARHQS